jgi:CheY-like chemotaxis protein
LHAASSEVVDVRVVQKGIVLAHLSDIQRSGERMTAVWHGGTPPFEPDEQLEPVVLESDDGLSREEAWLCRSFQDASGQIYVELGSEQDAPPWRRSSRQVEGATVAADVPGRVPEQSAGTADTQPRDRRGTARQKPNVLVVDDDVDVLDALADALEMEGWQVRKASNGRDAIALCRAERPDVAVVDLIMPEVSGEDVCRAIRSDPDQSHTRILVLSAAEDTRMVAADCEADGAITKPFTIALLLHEVRRLASP